MALLGYNVDIGYSTNGRNENLTQDKIVITDPNSLMTIPVVPDFESKERGYVIGRNKDEDIQQKMYDAMEYYIGSNVDSLYQLPICYYMRANSPTSTQYWTPVYDNFIYTFPSMEKNCPILFGLLQYGEAYQEHNMRWAILKFKSLNRILCVYIYNQSISGSVPMHVYDSNTFEKLYEGNFSSGNAYPLFMRLNAPLGRTAFYSVSVPVVINGDAPITESGNLHYVYIYAKYSSSNEEVSISAEELWDVGNSIFGKIFGTDVLTPDFTVDEGGIHQPDDPYEQGGDSKPGDLPPGTFDDTSDPIPDSPLPTLSAADTGFTRIYNPTLAQVQALARYLWTEESVLQTIWNHIKQFFENPMDAIIGFNLVPCEVPDGGTANFALMYIDTGVPMTTAANQFVDVDCGTVKLERYYGSALDQSPYTTVSCFLPFIGMVTLDTDEVMGTTLHVVYRIDIVSGSCVAKIFIDGNCLYQYSGHCAITIPFSSADFSNYVSAAISVAKLAVGAATAGVAGAAMAMGSGAGQETNNTTTRTWTEKETVRNPTTGRQVTAGARTITETVENHETSTKASFSGLTPSNIANTVGEIMGSKPQIEHSGSFSGNSGYLGIRRPYLIIERPNMCKPELYQQLNGFPSMITMVLGDCRGFTKVQQVKLDAVPATNPEQAEILSLLKMGVYF